MARAVIRVRMYRVGFGDCFLVTFPGPRHVLIDCGTLGTEENPALRAAADDIVKTGGGHLHAVIASHRHRDHVSGFSLAERLWQRVVVDAVWMPWLDDPGHAEASAIGRRLDDIAATLARRIRGQRGGRAMAALLANSRTDRVAMDVLQAGFAGNPRRRYLAAADREVEMEELDGVSVRVLGPPRSEESLRCLDLTSFVVLSAAQTRERGEDPFAQRFSLPPSETRRWFRNELRRRSPERDLTPRPPEPLAFWLDQTLNNQSLILILRYGRARLLFPGDAQWDGWLPILTSAEAAGEVATTDLYKVSHHGSLTGTPRELLERLGEVRSLVSTRARIWPDLPRRPLLTDLGRHGMVVRSDRDSSARGITSAKLWTDVELPA